VYRYDGQTFTNFTEMHGLASDQVVSIFEDTAGNLWFATERGASRYDGKRFTNFTAEDGLSDDEVADVTQDEGGDLWFGTRGGLNRFDGRTFTEVANPEGESFRNVRSLTVDRVGNLWIGSEDGLTRYDGQSLTRVSTLFTGYVFEDRTGTLWVSASVALLDRDPRGIMALYRYDETGLTLVATSGAVFGIESDAAGNIWFGTLEGPRKHDGETITTFTEEVGSFSPTAAPDGRR
jgi:ligand-binding sensor domain-containing protein